VSEHLIFVDTFRIRTGRDTEFRHLATEICAAVAHEEPRVIGYSLYVTDDGSHGTGIMIHPNDESVQAHGKIMRRYSARIMELTQLVRQEIFGPLPSARVDQIRRSVAQLGDIEVQTHDRLAGFIRPSTPTRGSASRQRS
jgi:hypothetical protein